MDVIELVRWMYSTPKPPEAGPAAALAAANAHATGAPAPSASGRGPQMTPSASAPHHASDHRAATAPAQPPRKAPKSKQRPSRPRGTTLDELNRLQVPLDSHTRGLPPPPVNRRPLVVPARLGYLTRTRSVPASAMLTQLACSPHSASLASLGAPPRQVPLAQLSPRRRAIRDSVANLEMIMRGPLASLSTCWM